MADRYEEPTGAPGQEVAPETKQPATLAFKIMLTAIKSLYATEASRQD